jgi:triacylglycerol lipase
MGRIKMIRKLWIIFALVFLAGCASRLPQGLRQSLTVVVPHKVDFVEIEHYGKRSLAAYDSPIKIRRAFPQTTRVSTVASVDVRYFVETDRVRKTQTISFRGTANKPNVWQDTETALVKDSLLDVNLHRGFHGDAQKVYTDLKPHLKKGYANRVTGHSLGGAIAMIIAGYMQADGFEMQRLVTFGQPKITDDGGNRTYTKTTRVVHDLDLIPMIPPASIKDKYRHLGPELVLREGPEYVYLDTHDADRLSVGQFWRNITDFSIKEHHMAQYLANVRAKIKGGARQVPYFGSKERSTSVEYGVPNYGWVG